MALSASTARAGVSQLYLFNPTVDLALVAGGITFLVLPVVFLVSPAAGAFAFVVLNLVANYPHYMATDYRVYGSRAQIHRYKFFAIYVTGFLVLTAVVSHLFVGTWVNVIVTIYALWTPYHYVGQNYGIAVMYAGRGGLRVTPAEKWLLYSSFIASMLTYLLLIVVRPAGSGMSLAQLNIPADVVRTAHVVLMVVSIAAAAILTWRLAQRSSLRVLTPVLMLMVVQFVWFATPGALILFRRQLSLADVDLQLFVPALAFLHSAQYLGVTTYYTKREQAQQDRPFRLPYYLLLLLVGGVLLWPVTIHLFSRVFIVDYAVSVMLLNALINLHHFILDGAIWKLRDGRLARLLISNDPFPSGQKALAASTGGAGVRESRPMSWLGAHRGLAWAMVACLALLIHGVDSLRVFVMLKAVGLRQAQRWQDAERFYRRALSLNSRVADADEGLAVTDMQAGDMASAAEHWARSVRLNPISPHLRAGLGETYLNLGRIDDAITQLEEAVRLAPEDTTGLSLLARARWAKGDHDGARALMDRARTVTAEAARRAQEL